ncbi:MAG: hypothetical protein DMG07_08960 [Acidobacteria bacterium]|nr:MAG: hypothetical protein DMG07_08960 [Acidobacteriota bacterium]
MLRGAYERASQEIPRMSQFRCSSFHLTTLSIAFAASTHLVVAQNPDARRDDRDYASELPHIPPKSPAESLKAFRVHPDFRIELVAAEPMLASPVALDFDEDGRLYIAEFTEFNQNASKQPLGRGRVRLLEDTDGDGRFDKSTIFLADLDATTAVCCYDGGVFVGAVPNILYARDTDGDGKADVRRVVFTGFGRDVGGEALFNSFRWLFDNRIHLSTSNSGGEVRHAERKDARPVSVRGQGFLFDPRTEAFAVTSGGGQHGMSMDDWGRKFVCTSHDPVFLVMYDGRYLARNPYLEAPAAATRIAPGGYDTKVSRISPNEPWRVVRTRLRTTGVEEPHPTEGDQPSGYFSAASGVTVFRGDAWPADYRGNLFVGEVSNNLIYRARLVPNGVGLTALRADPGAEFVASTDMWFRPVQMANGPDGALYVIDMYRFLIEAAEFMSPDIAKHLDFSAGFDKGRLYRIVPKGFEQPKPPRLSKVATADLVPLLDHPNGWHRDTASRLLYQRQDRTAVLPLRKLAAGAKSPLGRMHSLYALDGLQALDAGTVLHGLHDADSHVREHAVRLAEPFESAPEVRARLEELTDDPDLRVRYQLAFSLGSVSGEMPSRALVKLARRDGGDSWFRLAILSSANGRAGELFRLLVADTEFRVVPHGRTLLLALADLIGSARPRPGPDCKAATRRTRTVFSAGRGQGPARRPAPRRPQDSARRPAARGRSGGGDPHAWAHATQHPARSLPRSAQVPPAATRTGRCGGNARPLRPAWRPGDVAGGLAGLQPTIAGERGGGIVVPASLDRGLPRRRGAGQGQERRRGPRANPVAHDACGYPDPVPHR